MTRFAKRRDKLRGLLRRTDLPALLVCNSRNVSYLTGFTGEDSYFLLAERNAIVFSDPRFEIQLREECPDVDHEIRPPGTLLVPWTVRGVHAAKVRRLGIEGTALSVSTHGELAAEAKNVELVTTKGLVEELRAIKDREEIDLIRRAGQIAERGFAMMRAGLRPDQEERGIAHDLEHAMRSFGATGCAFPSIIAVGDRAALPHYRPGNRRIDEGGLLLVDWGAEYKQYRSDLTRVLVTGKISPKLKRVYEVVLTAQAAGIAALRPGADCEKVDAAARAVIEKAGFGKNFSHGLGHGVGLDIHEAPRLGPNAKGNLEPGMVVTVEPGIYLAGVGGVRIEDDVLITKDGHEVLTHVPKDWDDARVDLRLD